MSTVQQSSSYKIFCHCVRVISFTRPINMSCD